MVNTNHEAPECTSARLGCRGGLSYHGLVTRVIVQPVRDSYNVTLSSVNTGW